MAVRNIITVPNEVLYKKSKRVSKIDNTVRQEISDLLDTLESAHEPEGAGLAAPQIGISREICAVRRFFKDPQDPDKTLFSTFVLINPKIVSTSKDTEKRYEACLSVPNTYGLVERFKNIKVKYKDEKGEEKTLKASDFFARTIQHEIDHLNGVIFTSRVEGKTLTEKELDELNKNSDGNE